MEELDINDVQVYCITVKKKIGASDYQFENINKGFCVNYIRPRVLIHANVNEVNTYDEIGTIQYGDVGNVVLPDTNDSQCQILTQQQSGDISNEVIEKITDGKSIESNADFSNFDLPQREETDLQEQHMSISMDDINLIHADQPFD
ncbi:Hypothetical predicted protein [Mytilus galloprovincialis]|uniref:Uncharacterized protein n=1 Tax=Mytilus galloprovincialis TaxID=29158 RepID=A0A8B6FM02_MYTGA|nr:Hypothetical predicted protein [Mytilus galloprovincialis]